MLPHLLIKLLNFKPQTQKVTSCNNSPSCNLKFRIERFSSSFESTGVLYKVVDNGSSWNVSQYFLHIWNIPCVLYNILFNDNGQVGLLSTLPPCGRGPRSRWAGKCVPMPQPAWTQWTYSTWSPSMCAKKFEDFVWIKKWVDWGVIVEEKWSLDFPFAKGWWFWRLL